MFATSVGSKPISIGARNITPLITVFVNPFVKLYFVSIDISIPYYSYLVSTDLSTKRVCDNIRAYTLYPSVTGFENFHETVVVIPRSITWCYG